MALLGQPFDLSIRTSNKEREWSSICNNVFEQCLDIGDPFGFGAEPYERSSSDDSAKPFDFSMGCAQSHRTAGTPPIPLREHSERSTRQGAEATATEARQPKVYKPVNFSTKTLRALEQNAAVSEKQQRLREARSHPDFLVLASSPVDQSVSAQRRRSRQRSAANGRKASQARSLSRGRPSVATGAHSGGVPKFTINPYVTVRKASTSPNKMMSASRYSGLGTVAGFKDVWAKRAERSPKKYELCVSSQALLDSPPPSATFPYSAPLPTQALNQQDDDFAAFGSSSPTFVHLRVPNSGLAYDEQLSPLANTFRHAHIETPLASPLLAPVTAANSAAHTSNAWLHSIDVPPVSPLPPDAYDLQTQNVPVPDLAPFSTDHTSLLTTQRIQSFDFGFSSSPELDASYATALLAEPTAEYVVAHQPFPDPHAINTAVLPSTEYVGLPPAGLGISCQPSEFVDLPSTSFRRPSVSCAASPYYVPLPSGHHTATLPHTPQQHRSVPRLRSLSPSPPPLGHGHKAPATPSSRRNRRSSRHRRTRSEGQPSPHRRSTSHHTSPEKGASGFVNFTPQDSSKILSGVAPSGSSKTKARREKEAADKRRRLSQAAVRAVVEAGGDLDKLAEAGLLVDCKATV